MLWRLVWLGANFIVFFNKPFSSVQFREESGAPEAAPPSRLHVAKRVVFIKQKPARGAGLLLLIKKNARQYSGLIAIAAY